MTSRYPNNKARSLNNTSMKARSKILSSKSLHPMLFSLMEISETHPPKFWKTRISLKFQREETNRNHRHLQEGHRECSIISRAPWIQWPSGLTRWSSVSYVLTRGQSSETSSTTFEPIPRRNHSAAGSATNILVYSEISVGMKNSSRAWPNRSRRRSRLRMYPKSFKSKK